MNREQERIAEAEQKKAHWSQWGPYLSERQWGTVREDYSADGDAWNYFPFEQSAARAYRWGEDGIGGISDNHQTVCFAFAFWNEKDPCLKERLFGVTNEQGNHGEDVKEYYYYLDNTPTHSFMRMLYKYPQGEFPYQKLLVENRARTLRDCEYELIDTGLFDESRYFDVYLEYAKNSPDDLLIQATIWNRGPEEARIHLLPHLWLRNVWSWKNGERPGRIHREGRSLVLGERALYFEGAPETLFTENETNFETLFGTQNQSPYVKDAFHEAIVRGNKSAVNPKQEGTKSALHYVLSIPAGASAKVRMRWGPLKIQQPFAEFESIFTQRQKEADVFYGDLVPENISEDQRNVQRQAFAGLLWNKQFYHYIVEEWLEGDNPFAPPPASRKKGRNAQWKHVYSEDIFSMPDTWEYPWFASWDLAFHCIPLALIDSDFAKRQLSQLSRDWYMHPDGQIPAYEWNFEDVNPPVLAWAAWRVFKIEQRKQGKEDRAFLEQIFQKLVMNFTWWVNRKDQKGRNVFEGGFLGLDNISIFNRSEPPPDGGELTQSDATSWMAMFCLNMWTIAVELAIEEPTYEDMASKFFKHFLYIADAINFQHPHSPSLWDDEDGFYYDLLKKKDGSYQNLKIRSMVGLIPLFAVATLDKENLNSLPEFKERFEWFLESRSNLCAKVSSLHADGVNKRRLLSLLNREKLQQILEKMLDENEFLSPYGIRSLSQVHAEHPFILSCNGTLRKIDYEPAESTTRLYGGNSNWRGPIWFPLNFLIIESLQKYHHYYGDEFTIECPTGSGHQMTLAQVAEEISRRLISLFEQDEQGHRPIHGGTQKFQTDPHFRDHLLFYEYFHGDNGAGLGASHQTGWTALVAKLIQQLK